MTAARTAKILETERLFLREIGSNDAPFILELLNQPSFKKFIGDRGVRNLDQAREYIKTRFTDSYRNNGFGLYLMELKTNAASIGVCGFVKRDALPDPDIGFALITEYEKQSYAFEAASETMAYGRDVLGLTRVLAVTTLDNYSSGRLLGKIGLTHEQEIEINGETLKLYAWNAH